jgi:Zn-dependent peptidase ImmA (M78 family)
MRRPFNPDMLSLARDARGITQTDLVAALGDAMSQAKLSKIENGLVQPNDDDVAELAEALNFRPGFFYHPHRRRGEPPTYHRKRKKLSKRDWATTYAKAEIYRIASASFLKSVALAPRSPEPPSIDIDQYDGRPDEVAKAVRQYWSLPRGPVEDVTAVLENAGVLVVGFDFGTDLCDGFSQHGSDGMPPVVFINSRQPKDRFRFSLCHELAHLVMHRLPNPMMEYEANKFASAFLMPEEDIRKDLYNLSMEKFMSLKLYWRTSMQAIMYRAHGLGRITDSSYHYYMVSMSKRGWRSKEPVVLNNVREAPRIMGQLVRAHMGPLEYSADDMAELIGLPDAEFEAMFGVSDKPRLRLVT